MAAYADYSKARALLERPDVPGNVERAIERFGRAIARIRSSRSPTPASGEAYWAQYLETKDAAWTGRAQDIVTEALRLDPASRGRASRSRRLRGHGTRRRGARRAAQLLAQQPSNDDAHRLLGDILADRGRWQEAIAELSARWRLRPDYGDNASRAGPT